MSAANSKPTSNAASRSSTAPPPKVLYTLIVHDPDAFVVHPVHNPLAFFSRRDVADPARVPEVLAGTVELVPVDVPVMAVDPRDFPPMAIHQRHLHDREVDVPSSVQEHADLELHVRPPGHLVRELVFL